MFHSHRVKLNNNEWVIQDNTAQTTIDDFHGYEPILLKEAATETRIAQIKGNNSIVTKPKKTGRSGGGADGGADDAAGKTKQTAILVAEITTVYATSSKTPRLLAD